MMADYDDYKQKLSEGWSTEQVLEDPEITDPTITPAKDDGGTPPPPKETKPVKTPSEMNDKELVDSLNSMGTIARAGSSLAISMGLPVGAIVSAGLVNQYNNLLAEAESRGAKIPESAKRRGSIFGGEGSLTENLYQIDDDGNIIAGTAGQGDFGDTWLGDLLGFDGEAGVQGPGLRDSIGGARRYQGTGTESSSTTDTTSSRDSSPRPVLRPNDDDDGSPTLGSTPSGASQPTASTGGGMTGSDTRDDDPRGEGQYGGQSTSGPISQTSGLSQSEIEKNREIGAALGYNKGGLMANKKKKKK